MKKIFILFTLLTASVEGFSSPQWMLPTLYSPTYGSTVYSGVTLDWYAVASSTGYQLQVDTSTSFNSPLLYSVHKAYINSSSYNTDTEQYIENLLFGTTYYWRVRAYIPGDTSGWSGPWDFTTRDYITLYTPTSGSTAQYTGITLDWYAHTGVDYYDLELDTSASFNSPLLITHSETYTNSSSSNSDTEEYFENLLFGTTYYWRVRCRNAIDTSGWSTVWTFNTRDYITLYTPTSGSTAQYTGITLDWYAHTGVDYYDLELDTSASFNSPLLITHSETYTNSSSSNSDTEEYFENLLFGTTYYWRVRCRNAIDTSGWSTVWTFSTRDYITLYTPTNGSTAQYTGVTLDWYAHTGVDYYDLELDTTGNFNSPLLITHSETYTNSSSSNSDTEEYFENLLFGTTYYWRVRCRNANDTSGWSTVWTFSTRDYITLYSPTNGSGVYTGLTLDWYAHTGVDYYDLELDTSANFNSTLLTTHSDAYINSSSSNADTEEYFENLRFGTTYYWRVRCRNANDTSGWSSIWSFTTSNGLNLNSPSNGSSNYAGITLDWYSHYGVDYYDVEFDTSLTFASPALRTATNTYLNSSSSNSDTEEYFEDLYFGKTYYWRVRCRNAVDTSNWTNYWSVDIRDYVSLNTPANGATSVSTSGINLDWYSHYGIDLYQMQLDTTNLFNSASLVTIDKAYINSSSSNSDTYQHTGVLLSNQVYFWRVRAINAVDTTAWTERYFNTGSGTVLLPTTPVLSLPADGATGIPSTVTLEWDPATNADQYWYEYADNASFFSSISATTADTFALVSGLSSSNTTYYWRVRAIAGTNIYSNYSSTWDFTTGCALVAPSVSNPSPLCDSGNVTITASGSTGMYNFYASDGITLLHSGTSYSPPTIYSTDTFYVAAYDTVCESPQSMVVVQVVPSPPVPTVNQTGNTLYTDAGYTYQWYLAGTPVGGANGQFFDPPANGVYTVIVTDGNGCATESAPYNFTLTGIQSSSDISARLYPNPANSTIYLEFDVEKEAIIKILDLSGRVLSEYEFPAQKIMSIDISYLKAGSYIIICESDQTTVFRFNKL